MRLYLNLLGPLEITLGAKPVALRYDRLRALLEYLAVDSGRPHRRDALPGRAAVARVDGLGFTAGVAGPIYIGVGRLQEVSGLEAAMALTNDPIVVAFPNRAGRSPGSI